jgi:indolepyruvate ferredoxin oxidoreductase, alpha subunit
MKWIAKNEPGTVKLLMGNEAIARGAIEAGVQLTACYPGTPSSEIGEVIGGVAKDLNMYFEWSTNETVAFEVAAGASLAGARALTAMKNAGFNLVMDNFMTLTYGGIKGGFVVVVADDPGAHYSSNEQDTRLEAVAAELLIFEPQNQNQARLMTRAAFEISESLELPVFLRTVTRLSHASGNVEFGSISVDRNEIGFNKHWKIPYRWNVYGPPGPQSKREWLHSRLPLMAEYAEKSEFNYLKISNGKLGVITSGIAATYTKEALAELNLADNTNLLELGIVNPVPKLKVTEILKKSDQIVIIEEGDSAVENSVRLLAKEINPNLLIQGKLFENRVLPAEGELNPDIVRIGINRALGNHEKTDSAREMIKKQAKAIITSRSSTLCAGCPHLGSYWAIRKVLEKYDQNPIVNGDIGCYEQGGYGLATNKFEITDENNKRFKINSPYEILDTIYVMGSGIGMAQGQYQVGHKGKILAVAGDSTFFHTCLPAIANAVYNDADITFVVFDNTWTCMTGHQPNPVTGIKGNGDVATKISIEKVSEALGVNKVLIADAYEIEEAKKVLKSALDHKGPSIVILRRECALQVLRRKEKPLKKYEILQDKCIGCRSCVELGCPAITFKNKKADIDRALCVDCSLCAQVCPVNAIIGRSV